MPLYFETSVTYDKMHENGKVKKTTEKFLFDALSFTEAEARTIEERTPFISGDFSVRTAKKTKIAEIFGLGTTPDYWWLAKVAFIQLDEKTGVEKQTVTHILVGGYDFHDALDNFQDGMKGTMADYRILSLTQTEILEVYPADLASRSPEEEAPAHAPERAGSSGSEACQPKDESPEE